MKKSEIYLFIFSFVILLCSFSFAQQKDYQVVQNYQTKQQQLQESIKNAQSMDDLDQVQAQIDQLRNDFSINKDLLDKSLYPEDFNKSIEKLNNALTLRRGDFAQITTLKVQVTQMQSQVDSLNFKNTDLLNQVQQLKDSNTKDIARLDRAIRELRTSLAKRDRIIMSMLDSLMVPTGEGANMNSTEKERIYSQTKKNDVIENIKKSVDDNIKFLNVTTLTPVDLNTMKRQEEQFQRVWRNVGPEIVDVYSEKKQNVQNIQSIDSSFEVWNSSIDQGAWAAIRQKFSDRGITLDNFSNGREFTQSITSYIDGQIKNGGSGETAKASYANFVDSVWSGTVRVAWMPYLLNNNLLTSNDNDKMEARIEDWKNSVNPNNITWFYIILVVLVLAIIAFLVRASRSKKVKPSFKTTTT